MRVKVDSAHIIHDERALPRTRFPFGVDDLNAVSRDRSSSAGWFFRLPRNPERTVTGSLLSSTASVITCLTSLTAVMVLIWVSEGFTRATRSVVARKRVKEARRNLGREPLTKMRVSKKQHMTQKTGRQLHQIVLKMQEALKICVAKNLRRKNLALSSAVFRGKTKNAQGRLWCTMSPWLHATSRHLTPFP